MTPTATEPTFASDPARDLANESNVDLSKVKGTGKDGSIKTDDIRKVLDADAPKDEAKSEPKAKAKGFGSKGYDGAQPWEEDGPEVTISHVLPTLTSGSDGPEVAYLGELLDKLGIETSFTRGENPFSILDRSVLAGVNEFRRQYGVREDPRGYAVESDAANHVGPFTWEALLSAAE